MINAVTPDFFAIAYCSCFQIFKYCALWHFLLPMVGKGLKNHVLLPI